MSFARDIRPLFRPRDHEAMAFAFDLWSFDDVRSNASAILERIEDGTMPCDGPWNAAAVDQLRAWVKGGCQP